MAIDAMVAVDVRKTGLPSHMTPAYQRELLRARWRHKNGLEARTLVALARAPDVLADARERISAADFLSPAYAMAAALLLTTEFGAPVLELIGDGLDERPYLPDFSEDESEDEASRLVGLLQERRRRWESKG